MFCGRYERRSFPTAIIPTRNRPQRATGITHLKAAKKSKIKTRKTVVKRFTKTATGKLMRGKTGLNHLMRKKDANRKRNLNNDGELFKGDLKRIQRMLGKGLD